MAVASHPFHTLPAQSMQGSVVYKATGGDPIKMALFTTAPSLTTALYSSLTGEVAAGGGYSTGGQALTTLTVTPTEANSWSTAWATGVTHPVGDIIRPSTGNGYLYMAVSVSGTGTTGASEPTWPTAVGNTVVDNSGANQIIWENIGTSATVFSAASASWTSSTITASYAVIYDSTTSANIVMIDFGGSQSDSSGTFTVAPSSTAGWIAHFGN